MIACELERAREPRTEWMIGGLEAGQQDDGAIEANGVQLGAVGGERGGGGWCAWRRLGRAGGGMSRVVAWMGLVWLPREAGNAGLVEIGRLVVLLGPMSPNLEAALLRLHGVVEQRHRLPQAQIIDAGAVRQLRRVLKLP